MKKTILIILFAVLFLPNLVFAHPGRTDSNGCHYCRTNCASWGLRNGQYHCHNGGGSTSSSNNTYTKSSVNTINKIMINNEIVSVSNNMNYSTLEDTVSIGITLDHNKATYKIEGNTELSAGENNFKIKVTAENGNVRTYNLIITRILSSNTNIKVRINNEEIVFINNEYTIDVDSKTEKVEYDYELEDSKSTIKIEEPENLKSGENIIKFIVTAEDGTEATYSIIINKEKEEVEIIPEVEENDSEEKEESEEATLGDFIASFILLGTIGGAGGALAYFTNKPKK